MNNNFIFILPKIIKIQKIELFFIYLYKDINK